MHKHKAKKKLTITAGFSGCVNPDRCNPAAHGNVTDAETCHCGWQRSVNINQGHIEKSPWRPASAAAAFLDSRTASGNRVFQIVERSSD